MNKATRISIILASIAGISYHVLFADKTELVLYSSGNTHYEIAMTGLSKNGTSYEYSDSSYKSVIKTTKYVSGSKHGLESSFVSGNWPEHPSSKQLFTNNIPGDMISFTYFNGKNISS